MEKFLGDIGTEKPIAFRPFGHGKPYPCIQRRDGFDLFLYCYESDSLTTRVPNSLVRINLNLSHRVKLFQ